MSGLDEAGDLINSNSRTLAPAAVGSQVLLMSIVSIVTVVAFNILRPKNKIVYEPKVKYHVGSKPPPAISDSIFGWLPPLIHTKEPELLEKIGLDAVAFLRFLRLMRTLFSGIALLTCAILIPINITYNLRNVKSDDRDILSMLTIRDVGGNWLFAHVAVSYIVTFLLCGLVYINWVQMIRLRHAWFRSPEYLQSFYARTLLVTEVPKKFQTDEGLKAVFDSVKVPYPTTSVHIGRKVGKLPELIDYHNATVRELEEVLVKYLKGGKIGKKRPTIRIGGHWGCGGVKKDAIEFYTAKLKRTEAAIENYRSQIDTRKAENYGFASMAAVPYAHVVAKLLEGKHPKGTTIALAPNPRDIIWANMNKSQGTIMRNKTMGFLLLSVVCFFNTVPLFVISILANLNSLTVYVPFLESWATSSPSTFAIVSGVLPPAVSGLFGFFLPIMMRWLSQYMGGLTHSKLDRSVIARYFTFLVISQLVIFTLIGVIFKSVEEIVKQIGKKSFHDIISNLDTLPDTINRTYIDQASYWLTFFPLRGFLVVFDLAQIVHLVWISIKTRLFGRTPRDIREWTQPPEFQFALYYSNILFMGAVGLVFAPLAPLVALAAAIVFWMSSWVYKYQLMFVFVSKVETGGRLWNVVINRLLFCVLLMQALMILTIGLQYSFQTLQWLSTIPPILIVIAFKVYITRKFDNQFRYYIPSEDEIRLAQVHSERADSRQNRLEKRFGHPSLHMDLFTPMLHAKMMPLLSQVYQGKMGRQEAKLDEYGGQKMQATVVEGGVKIAAINQNDLEYDPRLYQRDRGELDWDARSMASTDMLTNDGASLYPSKSQFYANVPAMQSGSSGRFSPYNQYLANGPGQRSQADIELTRIDSIQSQREPLLSGDRQYFDPRSSPLGSQPTLVNPSTVSIPPSYQTHANAGVREAPIHRPYPTNENYPPNNYTPNNYPPNNYPQGNYPPDNYPQANYQTEYYTPSHSPERQYSPQQFAPQDGGAGNMAGRGAHRGY